jgi:hypothetical protein
MSICTNIEFCIAPSGGLGLIFLGSGRAWASYFRLGLYLGLKNLLNKLGFGRDRA